MVRFKTGKLARRRQKRGDKGGQFFQVAGICFRGSKLQKIHQIKLLMGPIILRSFAVVEVKESRWSGLNCRAFEAGALCIPGTLGKPKGFFQPKPITPYLGTSELCLCGWIQKTGRHAWLLCHFAATHHTAREWARNLQRPSSNSM